MATTYDRSPSGDLLHISRCGDGHLTLIIADAAGKSAKPVCIDPDDLPWVLAEMQAWAAVDAPSAMPHPT
jgi:hypothetical protein